MDMTLRNTTDYSTNSIIYIVGVFFGRGKSPNCGLTRKNRVMITTHSSASLMDVEIILSQPLEAHLQQDNIWQFTHKKELAMH